MTVIKITGKKLNTRHVMLGALHKSRSNLEHDTLTVVNH
jgi:hypothetical protein